MDTGEIKGMHFICIRTQIQNQWDKYDFVFENLKGFKKTNYERLMKY